jgi:hypothetical protein
MEPGRDPYAFDQDIADHVVRCLEEGRSLKTICCHKGMPSRGAVLHWLAVNPEFEARYFRAREIAMEAVADDLFHWAEAGIASDIAWVGTEPTLGQITQAHRTRIAVKQWLMARWASKTYGSRAAPREAAGAASGDVPPTPQPAGRRDPDAPKRMSPRPFTIPPIESEGAQTIGGLPISSAAELDRIVRRRAELAADVRATVASPSTPPLRPPRRLRRAMAAMARKKPAPSTNGSRAPPG